MIFVWKHIKKTKSFVCKYPCHEGHLGMFHVLQIRNKAVEFIQWEFMLDIQDILGINVDLRIKCMKHCQELSKTDVD